jgi:hypothetical protein
MKLEFLLALCFAVFGPPSHAFGMQAKARSAAPACHPEAFPSGIGTILKEQYGGWKVQDASSLSSRGLRNWVSIQKRASGCPGIAIGRFENSNLSYALLLVREAHPDAGYRLIVFRRPSATTDYRATVVDKFDGAGSTNFFIETVEIGGYFSSEQRKQLGIAASEGIFMMETAENEFGGEVFFWTRNGYRYEQREY